MFMSLQNSYVEIQMPTMMVLGSRASGRYLGHKNEDSRNGINDFMKRTPTELLLSCEDTRKSLEPGRGSSPNHAGILFLDFQPPEM